MFGIKLSLHLIISLNNKSIKNYSHVEWDIDLLLLLLLLLH